MQFSFMVMSLGVWMKAQEPLWCSALRHQARNRGEWEFLGTKPAEWPVTLSQARKLMANHFQKAKKTARVCPGSPQESKMIQRHIYIMKTFLIPTWNPEKCEWKVVCHWKSYNLTANQEYELKEKKLLNQAIKE